jgi:hypothetical protein
LALPYGSVDGARCQAPVLERIDQDRGSANGQEHHGHHSADVEALDGNVSAYAQIEVPQNQVYSSPKKRSDAEAVLARIADLTRDLVKLDRYERRALSRPKFATRELDALDDLTGA